MAAESSPSTAHSGDRSPTQQVEHFEQAWRRHRPDEALPQWTEFLPPAGQPCPADFVFLLLQTDIEARIKVGLPALLEQPYFQHPRLQTTDACLDSARKVQLVRWEYQHRWQRGARAARAEYAARFPD